MFAPSGSLQRRNILHQLSNDRWLEMAVMLTVFFIDHVFTRVELYDAFMLTEFFFQLLVQFFLLTEVVPANIPRHYLWIYFVYCTDKKLQQQSYAGRAVVALTETQGQYLGV